MGCNWLRGSGWDGNILLVAGLITAPHLTQCPPSRAPSAGPRRSPTEIRNNGFISSFLSIIATLSGPKGLSLWLWKFPKGSFTALSAMLAGLSLALALALHLRSAEISLEVIIIGRAGQLVPNTKNLIHHRKQKTFKELRIYGFKCPLVPWVISS